MINFDTMSYVPLIKAMAPQMAKEGIFQAKRAMRAVAHNTLHLTAATADLAYKDTLVAGSLVSFLLIGDLIFKPSFLFNSCKAAPLLEVWLWKCPAYEPRDRSVDEQIYRLQILLSMMTVVATPVAALTFRNIRQLAIKANQFF